MHNSGPINNRLNWIGAKCTCVTPFITATNDPINDSPIIKLILLFIQKIDLIYYGIITLHYIMYLPVYY